MFIVVATIFPDMMGDNKFTDIETTIYILILKRMNNKKYHLDIL